MPSLDGISPPIAFLAGLVSFISPCVLPLVPAYLAYLGARAAQPVVVSNGAAFALESAKPLVRQVNRHRRAIDLASAAVLLVMGLLLLTNKLTVLSAGLSQLVPGWPSPTI